MARPGGFAINFPAFTTSLTTSFMRRTSIITPTCTLAPDDKTGILSFWVKPASVASTMRIISTNEGNFTASILSNGSVEIVGKNSTGTQNLFIGSVSGAVGAGSTAHVFSIWDTSSGGTASLFVNNVDKISSFSISNDDIDYTDDYAIGATTTGANLYIGWLSEFYFAPGQVLGQTSATRGAFSSKISPPRPVSLGGNGSAPTGTAPLMYFTGASYSHNAALSSGGNFTKIGVLTIVPGPNPSDSVSSNAVTAAATRRSRRRKMLEALG
jgi:hypothetical protein